MCNYNSCVQIRFPSFKLCTMNHQTCLYQSISLKILYYMLLFIVGFINQEQSLFTYKQNFNWETYYDPNFEPLFEPDFLNATLEQQATEACGDDVFCLFDIATTGRMDIGLSTLNGSQNFDELVELSYPGNELYTVTWNV